MAAGRKLLIALLMLVWAVPLAAQTPTGSVAGRVFDASTQEALAGVSVTVGGRTMVTDTDGRYQIVGVPAGTHTLRVVRLGFADVTRQVDVVAGQRTVVDLPMTASAIALQGLVAVGYGERRAEEVTGSVAQITPQQFNTGLVVSADRAIQGKVAGVQVIDNEEPGGGVSIRFRGGTSVNASNEPLFVVDGQPLAGGLSFRGQNPLNFINPNDIANITILKDAAATAIYGSSGANGVVMIETKSGAGGSGMTYTGSVSTSRIARRPELLSALQFRAAVSERTPHLLPILGDATTDWQDAILRDGFSQEHNVAFGGSGEDLSYRFSLGYTDQEGIVRSSGVERLTASLNYHQRFFGDRLNIRTSLLGSRTAEEYMPEGAVGSSLNFDPTQPIFDPASPYGGYWEWAATNGPNNPVAEISMAQDRGRSYRSVGNITGEYLLPYITGLQATLRLGYDVTRAERIRFQPTILKAQAEAAPLSGFIARENPTQFTKSLATHLTYNRALESLQSTIELTGGYSYSDTRADFPTLEASGLEFDLLGPDGIPDAQRRLNWLNVEENRSVSFFGRTHFSVRDRYMLTASLRRDGSSRFGEGNRWGYFPAVAAAWRLSEEPFMQGRGPFSDLRLRASWGVNGNQAFGNYEHWLAYMIGQPTARYQFGEEYISTIRPDAVDPNLKWEETSSWNLGTDFGLLDNRLHGSIEYYTKDTKDLIFEVPVPNGSNLSDRVTTNVGTMSNKGVELALEALVTGTRGSTRGFSWAASFNAAYNKNQLTRIYAFGGGDEQIPVGFISGGVGNTIQLLRAGEPLNTFFVMRHIRENGKPVYADRNDDGQIDMADLYEDTNGDGVVNLDDRVPFESPNPDWILGHTSYMSYGPLDLSVSLRSQLGNYVYNNVASNQGNYNILRSSGHVNNLHASVLDTQFDQPQYFSDYYVEDASFLRMDNITLGYTLPALRSGQQVRVFGTVQNVFTITGYDGVDPIAGVNGIDNNRYPRARTFTAGASVRF